MKALILFALSVLLTVSAFPQQKGEIFVVRHAEKQSNAQDTPLSSKGKARAACLAKTLRDVRIGAIFVTQYLRTKQTAAPTEQQSKAIETAIDATSTQDIVSAARNAAKSTNVLIVGHSNTVPGLLAAFGTPSVTVPDTIYDQLFIFDVAKPSDLIVLHYCPELPTDTAAHPANSMAKP